MFFTKTHIENDRKVDWFRMVWKSKNYKKTAPEIFSRAAFCYLHYVMNNLFGYEHFLRSGKLPCL